MTAGQCSSVCNILLEDGRKLNDIQLYAPDGNGLFKIPSKTDLHFLSVVDLLRIPLHLVLGRPCSVFTSNSQTEDWFRHILLRALPGDESQWWEAAVCDAPLGILVAVKDLQDAQISQQPRVTELLLYATALRSPVLRSAEGILSESKVRNDPPGIPFKVDAVALSSDLLFRPQSDEPTPPPSPEPTDGNINGTFLSHPFSSATTIINEPPVRKRKSATDAFDEASERRKRARRKGGAGIPAAASNKAEVELPSLQHRRSDSNSQFLLSRHKRQSRSPSVSSRPATAVPGVSRPSTLSRAHSVTAVEDAPDIETKNKDMISRIVMAGMRLYGLSQSKRRKSRADSSAPSPAVDITFNELEMDRRNDEEFKLIYHQAYKGTCFAFRASIAHKSLQNCSETVRDVADRLLAIFCADPTTNDVGSGGEKVTSSGWAMFGSATASRRPG